MNRGATTGAGSYWLESHLQQLILLEHLTHVQQSEYLEHLIHVSRLLHGRNMLSDIAVFVKVLCFLEK